MHRKELSVIIIVQEEEENIRECLESVKWADEIVVVDSHSQDRTVEICKQYTEKIYQQEWQGFAPKKALALKKATKEWVLSIDADERVTPELKAEIEQILTRGKDCDGYYIPRKSYFLGKWMRHCGWYPGYQLKLFKRDKARVSDVHVHEGFLVNGRVGYLKGDIIHLSHPTLKESFEKLNRESSLEALDRVHRKRVRWYHFFAHPLAAFFNKFITKKGFLDGIHGLILSIVAAMVKMALYLKIWELQNINEHDHNFYHRS